MIDNLPLYITLTFSITVLATLLSFIWIIRRAYVGQGSRRGVIFTLIGLTIWLVIQAILTLSNTYSTAVNSIPPKIIVFGIFPPILIILLLFITKKGKQFIDSLPIKMLTYLNTVRIPVEIVLYWLFIQHAVPELMTFEGYNYDILAGISAPLMAYFAVSKKKINRQILLIWNIICLGLLLNIVILAVLSAPSPVQIFGLEQPNIALLYFPFSWLPTFIVPIILFGHLASIRQLLKDTH